MEYEDLKNRFEYHKPDIAKAKKHQDVRDECAELSLLLNDLLPEGREKSLAMTKLEEVMFWSNAAIARQADGSKD